MIGGACAVLRYMLYVKDTRGKVLVVGIWEEEFLFKADFCWLIFEEVWIELIEVETD